MEGDRKLYGALGGAGSDGELEGRRILEHTMYRWRSKLMATKKKQAWNTCFFPPLYYVNIIGYMSHISVMFGGQLLISISIK